MGLEQNTMSKNTKSKAVAKRYTPDEARQIVLEVFRDSSDPEQIFRDIAENLLPQLTHGTPQERERAKNWLIGKSDEAQMTMGLEHHYPLLDMVDRRYAALLLTIVRQIEKEYGCTGAIEKMLAENIGVAHIKIIDNSRRLNDLLGVMERNSDTETTHAAEMLSRQVDRAARQLYAALTTLRQIKHPQLEVNIINRNTFVAKNQQINATNPRS
jgi:hypothetical protein